MVVGFVVDYNDSVSFFEKLESFVFVFCFWDLLGCVNVFDFRGVGSGGCVVGFFYYGCVGIMSLLLKGYRGYVESIYNFLRRYCWLIVRSELWFW